MKTGKLLNLVSVKGIGIRWVNFREIGFPNTSIHFSHILLQFRINSTEQSLSFKGLDLNSETRGLDKQYIRISGIFYIRLKPEQMASNFQKCI